MNYLYQYGYQTKVNVKFRLYISKQVFYIVSTQLRLQFTIRFPFFLISFSPSSLYFFTTIIECFLNIFMLKHYGFSVGYF